MKKLTASWNDDTTTIILGEGIEILRNESLAGTPDLSTVVLPSTIKSIESNAFSSNVLGMANKKINFTYNGTMEEFQAISKASGWDAGLADNSTIHCTDGKAVLTRDWNKYTWNWTAN